MVQNCIKATVLVKMIRTCIGKNVKHHMIFHKTAVARHISIYFVRS